MKIEQLIVQYLYTNKKVTLQDIGIFYLSPNINIPPDQAKDSPLPENAITFEYNTKAVQDDNLIDFIVQQTRKIKPLATSDLESFTILGRQFMNIGKPLPIEGLGILQKNQQGEYEFIQGNTINARLEPVAALLKEKQKEDIVFTTPARKRNGSGAIVITVIVFLLLAAAAAFYFIVKNNKDQKAEQIAVPRTIDSTVKRKDSVVQRAQAPAMDTAHVQVPQAVDSGFKVVIREYANLAPAEIAFKRFTAGGYNLLLYTKDSTSYKIAMPFTRPLSDTAHLRDSLKKWFAGNPYIEVN